MNLNKKQSNGVGGLKPKKYTKKEWLAFAEGEIKGNLTRFAQDIFYTHVENKEHQDRLVEILTENFMSIVRKRP